MRELAGSIVPVVTPFTADGGVDLDTFAALMDWHARAGSHGVVITGTSGEPSVLTVAERGALVRTAVEVAAGRLTVVAATGSQSLADTLELSAVAERAGADALLVVTPYYIKPPQDGLLAYFDTVAGSVDLPMLIYHIPGRTGVQMAPTTVARLSEIRPTVVGMKHASTDLEYLSELFSRLSPGFRVFAGLEEHGFSMLALGAVGVMNAVGNIAPDMVAQLCDAMAAGSLAHARALHYQLLELNRAIFWETNPIPIKYLMVRLGLLPANAHRLPMTPAGPELMRRLDDLLQRTEWLTGADVRSAGFCTAG